VRDIIIYHSYIKLKFPVEAFCRSVDLGHNTNLLTIHLGWTVAGESWVVLRLLGQIMSSEMRQVAFPIGINNVKEIDWAGIASTLQQTRFSQLQKLVIFRVCEADKTWLMEKIPSGRARDKLMVILRGNYYIA
jgi:hypothetical protein